MVELVLGQGGSLKAEHGTGRMMAPYVRRQYGDELYEVMQEIKRLCDPPRHPQPGRADQRRRPTPTSATSRSPRPSRRRSTAAWNAATANRSAPAGTSPPPRGSGSCCAAKCNGPSPAATPRCCDQLEQEYEYDAIDTCAVDGMCQTACPVLINTGDLMKRLRADNAGKASAKGWACRREALGGHHPRPLPCALTAAGKLPSGLVNGPNRLGRKLIDPTRCRCGRPSCPVAAVPVPRATAVSERHIVRPMNHPPRRRCTSPRAWAPCSARPRPGPACGNPSSGSAVGPASR